MCSKSVGSKNNTQDVAAVLGEAVTHQWQSSLSHGVSYRPTATCLVGYVPGVPLLMETIPHQIPKWNMMSERDEWGSAGCLALLCLALSLALVFPPCFDLWIPAPECHSQWFRVVPQLSCFSRRPRITCDFLLRLWGIHDVMCIIRCLDFPWHLVELYFFIVFLEMKTSHVKTLCLFPFLQGGVWKKKKVL